MTKDKMRGWYGGIGATSITSFVIYMISSVGDHVEAYTTTWSDVAEAMLAFLILIVCAISVYRCFKD